ncbi:hypothetical protein TanjilG_22777 [Lupinus angustifolius]|uniref:Dof zinc finger protein n=1 Tax=Lupinus angustifolius TaxID=3871 RepID=A0A4P1RI24_LUPAN|nr:PREDICTED: dof zinc finger protein DOF3.4-like [Lupinus angustifolius]OIW10970.1 hypothetical protein TanjilG_22777 [Lupinus angustifolius]
MPSTDSGGNHRPSKPQNHGTQPPEQENLPCPRCDSINTKFCYYNNYNLSQPRHFCKSCRRYWTHGGTLRDIPVGGGTRRNAKRSRTLSSSTTVMASSTPVQDHTTLVPIPQGTKVQANPVSVCGSGGFTSLLNNGLGLEDVGFGMGRVGWAFPGMVDGGCIGGGVAVAGSGVGNTWQQFESGGEDGFVSGDCFTWPGLAISTPGYGLK